MKMKHGYFNSKGLLLNIFMGFLSLVSLSDIRAADKAEKLDDFIEITEKDLDAADVPTKHHDADGKLVQGGMTNGERVKLALNVVTKILAIIDYAPQIDFPGIVTAMRSLLSGKANYSNSIGKSDLKKVLQLISDIFSDKDSVFISLARIVPSKKAHAVAHRVQEMGTSLNLFIDILTVKDKFTELAQKAKNEKPIEVPKAPEVFGVTDAELDFS